MISFLCKIITILQYFKREHRCNSNFVERGPTSRTARKQSRKVLAHFEQCSMAGKDQKLEKSSKIQ